jgi:hypothetical protein
MALNAITMSAANAAISQKRVLASSLAIAITKATRIHRPKAGSRAAILNRNAATWSLATKLASEFARTIADHCSEESLERSLLAG